MELCKLTLLEALEKLTKGEISSFDLTESCLNRIKKYDKKIHAFLTVTEDIALEQARVSDERRKKKKILSKIDGIPMAVKDLFCTKGIKTTAGSKILKDFIPPFESTPTKKLWKAGAVLLGKTNLDEFAMGSSTENSAYGPTRNPWDLSRVPGGSSGGSAAAVAADMCIAAIGTDTGGSIRQPASLCGIIGLKPTYGRVSRYGVIAMASSLDQVGPMAKTAKDAAILLEILSGKDNLDSTSFDLKVPQYFENLNTSLEGKKIGIPKEFFGQGMDVEVEKIVRDGIKKLENLGVEIIEVSLPRVKYALAIYYIIMPAEVSSNLARYDGVRYGHSITKSEIFREITLNELYSKSRAEGFGAEQKRRIMLGSYVLSSGYYDAYYKKAQEARILIKQDFDQVFRKCDLLATPVSPTPAFKIGEKADDPLKMYLSDIHTVPINPAGLPAISVPAGFVDLPTGELPVGLQIIGPSWSEEKILQTAFSFEKENNILSKKPEL